MSLVVLNLVLKNCTAVAEVKLVPESGAKELHSKAWQSCQGARRRCLHTRISGSAIIFLSSTMNRDMVRRGREAAPNCTRSEEVGMKNVRGR